VVASAIKALTSDAIRALAQQIGRKIDHDDVEVTTDLVVLREPTLDINPDNSVHSVYGLGRLLVTATLR
jgi:hypothetical protein